MIRLVTLNLWQEQGPWEQRIELAGSCLAALGADVVCLQEVRQVPDRVPNQAETLARRLGMEHVFEAGQPWGGGDEGLAILSRHTLMRHEMRVLPTSARESRRLCLGAQIAAPDGPTWVFTTHLAYRLDDGALREEQVLAIDRFVQEHHRQGSGSTILAGDFNAVPDSDEMRYLRGLTSLGGQRTYYQDAFAQCNPGAPGITWSRENPYTAALDWLEPGRRIDYIYVTPRSRRGAGFIRSCRLVCTQPDERGVRCSDHHGLLAEVEVANTTSA